MTTTTDQPTVDMPVRKSITVNANADRAFRVFTAEFDTWWPRTHHIGTSPMKTAIIEPAAGGRCYTIQQDDTACDWGRVLLWEPPHRLVLAWQITHEWGYEPDLAQSSEVDIRFTPLEHGGTRVDLEHRYFDRHGAGAAAIRTAVGGPGGWSGLLDLFAAHVERTK
jgi:uncharacterized protein YndB with AHSA1/START domain